MAHDDEQHDRYFHRDDATPERRARFEIHSEMAARRAPGTIEVRGRTRDDAGVDVYAVADDMPLLVEGVLSALHDSGLSVVDVEHPIIAGESWIWARTDASTGSTDPEVIAQRVRAVLSRVQAVDEDLPTMREYLTALADELEPHVSSPGLEVNAEHVALLRWLADNRFTPLGGAPESGAGPELGIWRGHADDVGGFGEPPFRPLSIEQIYLPTGVHRSDYPYAVRVTRYGADGAIIGVYRFVGWFTVTAENADITEIPMVSRRVATVLSAADVLPDSYTGRMMLELMQVFGRGDLLTTRTEEIVRILHDVLAAMPTRELRLFLRPEPGGQVITALVYVPRDRYTTKLRLELQELLAQELSGSSLEYTARVGESVLALLRVVMRVPADQHPDVDALATGGARQQEIQRVLTLAARTWDERVRDAAARDGVDSDLVGHYLAALHDRYRTDRLPEDALADITAVDALAEGQLAVRVGQNMAAAATMAEVPHDTRWSFTFYQAGQHATLSDVLPVLQSLCVQVLDERPYEFERPDGMHCWVYEFGIELPDDLTPYPIGDPGHELRFAEAFAQIWRGEADIDIFNELVLRCGISGRQVAMLRAYGRYLAQCGFPYRTANLAKTLGEHVDLTRSLVELFGRSFDPDSADDAERSRILDRLSADIGEIISLDADRILRAYVAVITATDRTNYYNDHPVLSFKLRPRDIPQTPLPRPLHEIYVYSPRVEGVHLRFGAVARGGLRWSDRLVDYRTEILGLVKAQAVKNAVIVPVGAKGGFIVKRPPNPTGDPAADREAQRAEGVARYRLFISGLLDITDNLDPATGETIPPAGVTRRDGDDAYLVVAADKGTATFSDIANSVAREYGFWLGDAFASGGSAGYDHKQMGITARGAWESVKRHFREMGIDTQRDEFTVAGIGDMSGDVFGNGMLLSPHIRLIAAFDHRHVFLDPDPLPQKSFDERARMFALPRSSWADYDETLISSGGGVWSRDRKSIPVSPEAAAALGIDPEITELAPPDLIRAILLAPVDLLWNGGIGTYIKSSTETNDEVGDKANDAIRVNGNQLRAKVVGEGGNLGATGRGRIEFDLAGGRINTDAMDNSAGVDCSDHEVNIKIVLASAISSGLLPESERNEVLASMTPEVSDLVLSDNISQNAELGVARASALDRVEVHARLLAQLANEYDVDLELEDLPTPRQLRKRVETEGRGLTSPELATLMAHVKLTLKAEMLSTDLADNQLFSDRLLNYFPRRLQTDYPEQIRGHSLRREIVATVVVNEVVDQGGITHAFRLAEGSGTGPIDVLRSYAAITEIFGLPELWERIDAAPVAVETIAEMRNHVRRLLFRASRWELANRPQPLAMRAEIARYRDRVERYRDQVPEWLCGGAAARVADRTQRLVAAGVDGGLAASVAISLDEFSLLDIVDIAEINERRIDEVGALYFALADRLAMDELLHAVTQLDRDDRWHALARLALRDDLQGAVRSLTQRVLEIGLPDESPDVKIRDWASSNASSIGRVESTLADIRSTGSLDLATLSVAARQIRSLVR
jgi:glutamate dehydrogenase